MKHTKHFYCLLTAFCLSATIAFSQTRNNNIFNRCATDEAISEARKRNPSFDEELFRKNKVINNESLNSLSNRTSTLSGPVTIPVIIHVVDANPYRVTEEQVDYFLDRLNKDFSGFNPDSANGSAFYSVRGHSLLRFTRARRDPSGNLTNGIERKNGTVSIANTTYQPLKHSSDGGLDPWDVTKYYNLWVGSSGATGILGVAPAIGVGGQTETTSSTTGIDGICLAIESFSNGCFTIPDYSLARTAVHEIGHNFGLFHIFSGCTTGADFIQLTPSGQTLPSNLLTSADDTPSQSTNTVGCPAGIVASNCTGIANPPGKMYQNYMDYTSDACYSMFTIGQVNRMHYVLENYRTGYLTSNGATPPASAPALDIATVSVVSPGGSEFNTGTCVTTSYPIPSCPGSFVPKLMIINNGSSTITSISGICTVNGVPSPLQTFTVNMLTGRTTVLTFPTANLIGGVNTITFTTSLPNGLPDQVTSNDVLTKTVTIAASVTAPIIEGFEGSFPPTNWTLSQLSGTGNWAKTTLSSKTGLASAKFDNYNYLAGTASALYSPSVSFSPSATAATVSFQYAYRQYDASSVDKMEVLISTNCSNIWTSLWSRTGSALVTTTGVQTTAFTPTAAQWTQIPISIDLTAYKNQTIQLQFKATSAYGNNLYLDDVKIYDTIIYPNEAMVFQINSPATSVCSGTITPQVVVKNNGSSTLTSVTVRSAVDPAVGANLSSYASQTFTGLNVASGGTTLLTLTPVTGISNGLHNFKSFTNFPNGIVDLVSSNDTLSKTFTANVATTSFPIVEGFETVWTGTATAPILPNGWAVINPDNAATWEKNTISFKSGTSSVSINNYVYNAVGQLDYLRSPLVNFSGKDSAYLTFHYAYKLYDAASTDTLEIVVSTDCGNNWSSIWKKGGSDLATATGFITSAYIPTALEWTVAPIFVNLSAYINSGPVYIAFRNKNKYGQRLFIDDISIKGTLLALPVTLLSFDASLNSNKTVNLQWKTANEINNKLFVVEKSSNGVSFFAMDSINAKNGSTNSYELNDAQPLDGINYYRLKQLDKNGSFTYSNIVSVNLKSNGINAFSIYPNPVKDVLSLNINSTKAAKASVIVTDISGRMISSSFIDLVKGNQSSTINITNLKCGNYQITLVWDNERITQKLVKL